MILFLQILALLTSIIFLTLMYMFLSYFVSLRIKIKPQKIHENSIINGTSQLTDEIQMKAIISCNRIAPDVPTFFQVSGYADCHTLQGMFQGNMLCRHGCLGLGSCTYVCPADAIIIEKGTIFVSDACIGCGNCISECPKQLISLVPVNSSSSFLCATHEIAGDFSFCPTAKNGYRIKN